MYTADKEDSESPEDDSLPQDQSSSQEGSQDIQTNTAKKGKPSQMRQRSVSKLTPAQLARKRAHDRDAQRNARQRTKNYIESLEAQIQELLKSSDTKNASELAELRLSNQKLMDSMAELKTKMAMDAQAPGRALNPLTGPEYFDQVAPRSGSFEPSAYLKEEESVDQPANYAPRITSFAYIDRAKKTRSVQEFDDLSSDITLNTKLSLFQLNTAVNIPTSFVNQPTTKFWELPVLLLPPENAVSGSLVKMVHDIRREQVCSPWKDQFLRDPTFRSIISYGSETDLLSMALFNLMLSAGMIRIPEIIAAIWGAYKLIQWQIRPCLETYNNLPAWLSPRPSQLVTPHPHWVTMLQFPKLRDKVIERQDLYANSKFLSLYPQSLRIHWPYDVIDTLNMENGQITEAFLEHFLDIGNWSLTAPFTLEYPELISICRYTIGE